MNDLLRYTLISKNFKALQRKSWLIILNGKMSDLRCIDSKEIIRFGIMMIEKNYNSSQNDTLYDDDDSRIICNNKQLSSEFAFKFKIEDNSKNDLYLYRTILYLEFKRSQRYTFVKNLIDFSRDLRLYATTRELIYPYFIDESNPAMFFGPILYGTVPDLVKLYFHPLRNSFSEIIQSPQNVSKKAFKDIQILRDLIDAGIILDDLCVYEPILSKKWINFIKTFLNER